jgi:hypothetical protein
MTANRDLAGRARQLADGAPNGSAGRKAYGCAYVALTTTGTIAGARKALGDVYPPEVGRDAMAALDQLAQEVSP